MSCASQLPRQGWAESQSHLHGPRPHTLPLHSSRGVLFLKLGRGCTNRSLRYPRSSSLLEVFQNKDEEGNERRVQTIRRRCLVNSLKPTTSHQHQTKHTLTRARLPAPPAEALKARAAGQRRQARRRARKLPAGASPSAGPRQRSKPTKGTAPTTSCWHAQACI